MTDVQEKRDLKELERLLDRTKTEVFLGSNAAFLAPLMCSLNFYWTDDIPTACTNGLNIQWNPDFFLSLDNKTRVTVIAHELWHVAKLHNLRRGTRIPLIWNYACDYNINNDLERDGYYMAGFPYLIDQQYYGKSEEEIYDLLVDDMSKEFKEIYGDLVPSDEIDPHTIINTVVQAHISAGLGGKWAGSVKADAIEKLLEQFLSPKLPWDVLLNQWMHQISTEDFSWARPNRRYSDIYLPSRIAQEGGLDHVMMFEDTSGSITNQQSIRFNSEIHHIKESFNPEKLTVVMFDEEITFEKTFERDEKFERVTVIGRRGTSLVPVREHIIKHKPTAVIIFSDMHVAPMEKLPIELGIPIIWIVLNNNNATVNEGKLVYFTE